MRTQATISLTTAILALPLGIAMGNVTARQAHDAILACAANAKPMSRLDLMFGAARKSAPPVTDEEWQSFLDAEITPRFPDGLTVLTGNGQWRSPDGTLVKEPSRMLLVWYTPTPAIGLDVEAIRTAYKSRFGQDSVMRVDDATSCVSF